MDIIFICLPSDLVMYFKNIFSKSNISVNKVICSSYVKSINYKNNLNLKGHSSFIDVGLNKTSIISYLDNNILSLDVLPIGGNHITKDISKVCSLQFEEAENIKNKIDFSFKDKNRLFDHEEFLKPTYFINTSFRKISKNLLFDITKERLNEIFNIIKKELTFLDTNSYFGKNLYITGGGSNLINFNEYCSNFFRSDVKKINKSDNNEKKYNLEEKFHSCLGALKIIKDGWETEAIPESAERYGEKTGFFAKIFGYGS